MSAVTIHIEMPPYLVQWFVDLNGGGDPVILDSGSVVYKKIRTSLIGEPNVAYKPDLSESHVSIFFPDVETIEGIPMDYLTRGDREELAVFIRDSFLADFMAFMVKARRKRTRTDLRIEAFMETTGIEFNDTNWNALAKIYQRQLNADRVRKYRSKKKVQKNRSKKR